MLAPSLMVQFEAQNLSTLDFKVACQSAIRKYLDNPDSDSNKTEFIELCLRENVSDRPDAKALSRHRALFELSPLQILASHKVYEYRTICQKELDNKLKKVEAESDDTVIILKSSLISFKGIAQFFLNFFKKPPLILSRFV